MTSLLPCASPAMIRMPSVVASAVRAWLRAAMASIVVLMITRRLRRATVIARRWLLLLLLLGVVVGLLLLLLLLLLLVLVMVVSVLTLVRCSMLLRLRLSVGVRLLLLLVLVEVGGRRRRRAGGGGDPPYAGAALAHRHGRAHRRQLLRRPAARPHAAREARMMGVAGLRRWLTDARDLGLSARVAGALLGLQFLAILSEGAGVAMLVPIFQFMQEGGDLATFTARDELWESREALEAFIQRPGIVEKFIDRDLAAYGNVALGNGRIAGLQS